MMYRRALPYLHCRYLIADLFLANLKFKYMDKLVSSKSPDNLRMAKKISNNSRYIDDIGVCNNNDFMICCKDIYPDSIPLNPFTSIGRTSTSKGKVRVRDICLNI